MYLQWAVRPFWWEAFKSNLQGSLQTFWDAMLLTVTIPSQILTAFLGGFFQLNRFSISNSLERFSKTSKVFFLVFFNQFTQSKFLLVWIVFLITSREFSSSTHYYYISYEMFPIYCGYFPVYSEWYSNFSIYRNVCNYVSWKSQKFSPV